MGRDEGAGIDAHIAGVDYVLEPGAYLVVVDAEGQVDAKTLRPWDHAKIDDDISDIRVLP